MDLLEISPAEENLIATFKEDIYSVYKENNNKDLMHALYKKFIIACGDPKANWVDSMKTLGITYNRAKLQEYDQKHQTTMNKRWKRVAKYFLDQKIVSTAAPSALSDF